jgi:two-component system sensor histidine kinase/response regulator
MSHVFDQRELLDRVDHDWEFLSETVQLLATDGRALMVQVRQAVDSGDAISLGRNAHTLKGMIANFCSPTALASAFELEKIAKGGDLSPAPAAVKTLETQLESLIAGLNELLATRS